MNKQLLIVVAGPTASGKTRLAIDIAKAFDGEIVSADSMQIYKYMDIGTAKPTDEERAECRHHLIDFKEPDEIFSVADYAKLAHEVIRDISERGRLPVICGGTGLYINSVVDDVTFGDMDTDYALREELKDIAEKDGGERLLDMLAEFDPVSAERLHPNNQRRIIRAIEFYKSTGVPISEHQEMTKQTESRYEPIMFAIDHPREVLYERINLRVDFMIKDGLLEEVKKIMDMGYTKELNSMKGIGYKEIMDYYNGECTLHEAIEAVKQGSRRYAKRQLTWFRRDKRIIMLEPHSAAETAIEIIKRSLYP
ncbi:MAG: tRNA (adenosine(37)-N6)-dimethylallyltransferase MiaA [Oscillospiraceae bacterium]|nr:tRNA (adenosine(37)-N6)-dimethylallyltransferase MiaA [Oscillospiraceae bacterium]